MATPTEDGDFLTVALANTGHRSKGSCLIRDILARLDPAVAASAAKAMDLPKGDPERPSSTGIVKAFKEFGCEVSRNAVDRHRLSDGDRQCSCD